MIFKLCNFTEKDIHQFQEYFFFFFEKKPSSPNFLYVCSTEISFHDETSEIFPQFKFLSQNLSLEGNFFPWWQSNKNMTPHHRIRKKSLRFH